jgi:hypothetical protein
MALKILQSHFIDYLKLIKLKQCEPFVIRKCLLSSFVGHDTPSSTQYSSVGHDTHYSIDKEAIRLIKFQRPIDHNRAICLDYSEKYLALSQVKNGKDRIRVFKLHSNTIL